jgi:hypothetical protein
VNEIIQETGFSVVRKPGLFPCIKEIRPMQVPWVHQNMALEDFFEATLPGNCFSHITTTTNKCHKNIPGGPITEEEVRKWLGQTIILQITKLRANKDLWAKSGITINYPNKQNGLSKKRWEWINANMEYDEEFIHTLFTKSWQSAVSPGTFVTCDEARIASHPADEERLSFNKDKPERWALECHTLHDTSSHYLLNMDRPKQYSPFESLIELPKCLPGGKVYHITADKAFGNINQAELLRQQGLLFTL